MSFAAAQAIELNNYSTQYGHLRKSDIFVAPGQIGMVVLVDGITSEIFVFEPPPNASQAAPSAGQICLIKTYEEAPGPGGAPPLGPAPGILLPIGLDSPQHLHHVSGTHAHNPHLHGITGTHLHSDVHNHPISTINGFTTTGGIQGVSGTLATLDHTHNANGFSSFADVTGNYTGNTGSSSPGNTDNANVPAASSGDTDLENVQHTHP